MKNKIEFVNMTPHTLNVHQENGEIKNIPASGAVARVSVKTEKVGEYDGVALFKTMMGEVEGLPEQEDGKIYITSLLVAEKARRADVVSPGNLIRNEAGQPVGCKGLTAWV